MTAAQTLFFRILSDFVRGRETVPDGLDFDHRELYDLLHRQNLLGLAYVQLRNVLEKDGWLGKKLYSGFCTDVFFAVNREQAQEEVFQALTAAGIPVLSFKGAVLANYYPEPRLRTMGDVDLLIPTACREQAHEIMQGLGYDFMMDNPSVWTYHRDVALFEIHDRMMYDPLANDVDYGAFFDRAWEFVREDKLTPEFHFLYLIAHTAKHIINQGYGIRGFLDLVLFVREEQGLDFDWIVEKLRELHLLDFARTCFTLCGRWFDLELPPELPGVTEEFYRSATEKLFQDGLWGFSNRENAVGVSARTIRRSRAPYWLTACGMTLRKLFPPYRELRLIPWYGFVDGRPWLLPAAWVYRFGYCLTHKAGHGGRLLGEPFVKAREIRAREALIDSWGL